MEDRERLPPVDGPAWTLRAAVGAMFRPEIYKMVLFIYVPLLIPLAVGMALAGRWVDGILGWGPLPGAPFNFILFVFFTSAGLLIVGWCYSYLVIVGGGGPAPLVADQCPRLVMDGPYALSRHPSVLGKLLGVVGLAFLVRSPFFLLVIIPLLVAGSLLEKRYFMERRELNNWDEEYRSYIRRVPFFVPRLSDLLKHLRGDPPARGPETAQNPPADLSSQQGGGDHAGHVDPVGDGGEPDE